MEKRSSGILMHISSLPGDYGIGDFGKEAYSFTDFLEKANQSYWQILPLGVTGFGDSPYQCFSSFAGNPYFIDLDEFIEKEYLDRETIEKTQLEQEADRVDYGLLNENKIRLLRLAYKNSFYEIQDKLKDFYRKEASWLRDFALFMSIKRRFKMEAWYKWPMDYRDYKSLKVRDFEEENQDEIYFWIFTQYFFMKQWKKLKSYANRKNIRIVGDLPIYVSGDSCDVWRKPQYFKLDQKLQFGKVAGVPPDYFSPQGQLWGNPIYRWEEIEKDDYKWWIERISFALNQVDKLRLDHFRGFASYWEIDSNEENAIKGQWEKGPGIKLFQKLKEKLGDPDIIVEDLGIISKDVEDLVKASGFPNMKVLQFGFNPYDESNHIPHRISENSVVYTGTHDNDTTMSWFKGLSEEEFTYVSNYLKLDEIEGLNWGFLRGAWASKASIAIGPIQDFLGLENARMNIPGTSLNNWTWRIKKGYLDDKLAERIRNMTDLYNR